MLFLKKKEAKQLKKLQLKFRGNLIIFFPCLF
jgi:hypothetical protein